LRFCNPSHSLTLEPRRVSPAPQRPWPCVDRRSPPHRARPRSPTLRPGGTRPGCAEDRARALPLARTRPSKARPESTNRGPSAPAPSALALLFESSSVAPFARDHLWRTARHELQAISEGPSTLSRRRPASPLPMCPDRTHSVPLALTHPLKFRRERWATMSPPGRGRQITQPPKRRASSFGRDEGFNSTRCDGYQLGGRAATISDRYHLATSRLSHHSRCVLLQGTNSNFGHVPRCSTTHLRCLPAANVYIGFRARKG